MCTFFPQMKLTYLFRGPWWGGVITKNDILFPVFFKGRLFLMTWVAITISIEF